MRYRRAAWIIFLTCSVALLLIWSTSPFLISSDENWADVVYTIYFYTVYVAFPLGLIAAVYLLTVYFVWGLRKARKHGKSASLNQ